NSLIMAISLQAKHVIQHHRREADASVLRHLGTDPFRQNAAEDLFSMAAGKPVVHFDAFQHHANHLPKEYCFKFTRSLAGLTCSSMTGRRTRTRQWLKTGRANRIHHCTSISACRAPALFTARRIVIKSRGLTPKALRPLTRSRTAVP